MENFIFFVVEAANYIGKIFKNQVDLKSLDFGFKTEETSKSCKKRQNYVNSTEDAVNSPKISYIVCK